MQLPGGNVSLRGTIGCSPLGVLQRGMGGCLQELHGGLVHTEELHRHRLDKRQSILGGVAHWKGLPYRDCSNQHVEWSNKDTSQI